ncbi:MAG: hypothetical protein KDA44_07110 [Planctomycetales bacterium]|nr:hypothetical protein [Planctomycetales bacterium]
MEALDAIYMKDGTLRLATPLELPDSTPVKVTIDVQTADGAQSSLDAVYQALDQRCETGIADLAARHDEHQP